MSIVMISDNSMREIIRSLNFQQNQIFDKIYNWCKSKCKNRNSLKKKKVNPLNVFISGGGGASKWYFINTFFTRALNFYSGTPEKVKRLKY